MSRIGSRIIFKRFREAVFAAWVISLVTPYSWGAVRKSTPPRLLGYQVQITEIHNQEGIVEYSIVTLEPVADSDSLPDIKELAKLLRIEANNWSVEERKSRFPEKNPAYFEAMKGENPLDGRTSLALVYPGAAFDQPMGMIAYTYRTADNPQLPVEKSTHLSFKDSGTNFQKTKRHSFGSHQWNEIVVAQGEIEIRKLVIGRNATDDILPLLYWAAEERSLSIHPASTGISRKIRKRVPRAILGDAKDVSIVPSRYLVHCYAQLVPVYKRMGFKMSKRQTKKTKQLLKQGLPLPSDAEVVMEMSHAQYESLKKDFMNRRVGSRLVIRASGADATRLGIHKIWALAKRIQARCMGTELDKRVLQNPPWSLIIDQ